jgi:hypothetical protein
MGNELKITQPKFNTLKSNVEGAVSFIDVSGKEKKYQSDKHVLIEDQQVQIEIFNALSKHKFGQNVINNTTKLSEDIFTKVHQNAVNKTEHGTQGASEHQLVNVHALYNNLMKVFTDPKSDGGEALTVAEQRKMIEAFANNLMIEQK